jgi:hypothetical protein
MSPNKKIEENADELSSKNEPENTQVECVEYNLRLRCLKTVDGNRSCKIEDISVIEPNTDEKKAVEPADPAEKQDVVPPVVASGGVVKKEASKEECSVCEVLGDLVKEKVRTAAPRQFHLSGRPRRMIRS